jgi:hypothetical protein
MLPACVFKEFILYKIKFTLTKHADISACFVSTKVPSPYHANSRVNPTDK